MTHLPASSPLPGRPARLARLVLLSVCFSYLALPAPTHAQSTVDLQLAWDRNTETNIAGYKLYYGLSSGSYTRTIAAGTNTTVWARGLEGGLNYYFAVTAYNLNGVESDFSAEVSYQTVALGVPNRPPTLDPIPDISLPINCGPSQISITGIGAGSEDEIQVLRLTAVSSNPDLLPNPIVLRVESYDSGTLLLNPRLNASGLATVTLTVNDGASRSNTAQRTFAVRIGTPPHQSFYREAESGVLTAPMKPMADGATSGQTYITTGQSENGAARYQVNLDQGDSYVVWCRVRSLDGGSDSFYVSVDGGAEDVFDTGLSLFSTAWQWVMLNGRATGNPRRLALSSGPHTLTFRGRESLTGLDAFYITNDPLFVPVGLTLTRVNGTSPGMKVTFQSPPGYRYDVQATEDFRTWTTLWRSAVASANQQFEYTDLTRPPSGKRFYRLLVQ